MRIADLLPLLLPDARFIGDERAPVRALRAWDGQFGPDEMTLALARRAGNLDALAAHPAATIITDIDPQGRDIGKNLIVSPRARMQMAKLSHCFATETQDFTDASPTFPPGVRVHPRAHVSSDVVIGEGTVIHANVTIYRGVTIGRRCVVHSGTVLGADGFGYERDEDGSWFRIAHLGGIVIGDDVEIGANTCIDRGTLGPTVIESGVKIDNLVHVAHNVRIGKDSVVIANAMLGGSVMLGERTYVAPSATIRDTKKIGAGAMVGLGAVVVSDVPPGVTVMGVPAKPREK